MFTICFRQYIIYIQSNMKQQQQKNLIKFRQLCNTKLKRQAPNYLISFIKSNSLIIDLDMIAPQDLQLIQMIFFLSFSSIKIQGNYCKSGEKKQRIKSKNFAQSPNYRFIFKYINRNIEHSNIIKSLVFQNIPIPQKQLLDLRAGLENTKTLKQFAIIGCNITQYHLQGLTHSLCANQSLITLNFSQNNLVYVGEIIGKILSQHSQRRNQILWLYGIRNELPEEDISTTGICQVNLQGNQINDKAIIQFMKFFRFDNWTRSLNLKRNIIGDQGIQQFASLMKKNTSLIALDLRQNPGFEKQYSRLIFKKLVKNIENFKKYKQNYNKKKQNSLSKSRSKSIKKQKHNSYFLQKKVANQQKPSYINNLTLQNPKQNSFKCENCKYSQIHLLQVQKKNLDLIIENHKLKQLIFPKNFEVSAINPPPIQSHQLEEISFNIRNLQNNEHSQDLLQKMEYIMLQLTKILENIQLQHQTQVNISNPLSNTINNFSNTVQILASNNQNSEQIYHQQSNQIEQISNIE